MSDRFDYLKFFESSIILNRLLIILQKKKKYSYLFWVLIFKAMYSLCKRWKHCLREKFKLKRRLRWNICSTVGNYKIIEACLQLYHNLEISRNMKVSLAIFF